MAGERQPSYSSPGVTEFSQRTETTAPGPGFAATPPPLAVAPALLRRVPHLPAFFPERAVFAGRGFSWGALGVEVAVSGLRHRAVTRDGLVEEDIPLLRLGFAGELGLWSTKP